jgi:hypothetical protein
MISVDVTRSIIADAFPLEIFGPMLVITFIGGAIIAKRKNKK